MNVTPYTLAGDFLLLPRSRYRSIGWRGGKASELQLRWLKRGVVIIWGITRP